MPWRLDLRSEITTPKNHISHDDLTFESSSAQLCWKTVKTFLVKEVKLS